MVIATLNDYVKRDWCFKSNNQTIYVFCKMIYKSNNQTPEKPTNLIGRGVEGKNGLFTGEWLYRYGF